MKTELGKMIKIENLREGWADEARDFTPWVASEEGIKLLGEFLGMELEVEGTEQGVGSFSADIVCNNTYNNSKVLIENQLEKTDHKHLGQLLTYANGFEAETIIWIAKEFLEEHRATLDWLNEITDTKHRFFGVEIELWKIDDSRSAPKFNIVCKPNDWSKNVREISNKSISQGNKLQLEFWTGLRDYLEDKNSQIKLHNPSPQHWVYFSLGKYGLRGVVHFLVRSKVIGFGFEMYGADKDGLFGLLHKEQSKIEKEAGCKFEWENSSDNQYARAWHRYSAEVSDTEKWDGYYKKLQSSLDKLNACLQTRIPNLNPEDWEPEVNEPDSNKNREKEKK